jgi:hypothetical protein
MIDANVGNNQEVLPEYQVLHLLGGKTGALILVGAEYWDSRISRFVRAAISVSLNLKTGLDRGGGCQARESLMAAKNIGFGGGHLELGLAVAVVMMESEQRSCPWLGELGVAQLLPLVET